MPITLQAASFTIKPVAGKLDSRTPTGAAVNSAPVATAIDDKTIQAGTVGQTLAGYWSDPDGDTMTFGREASNAGTAPAGVTINSAGVPSVAADVPPSAPGIPYTVIMYADDGRSSAEDDWLSRRSGAGVVWAHDFRYPAEVSAFMGPNSGSEPLPVQDADGPTGYSLKYTNRAGLPNMTANWGRILSPVYAGENGLPYDDPAAGATIPKRHWTAGSKAQANWGYGYYAHSSYIGAYPSWAPPGGGAATGASAIEGTEFYLQFRIKISASRWAAENAAQVQGSKLWFVDAAGWLANQQLVGYIDMHGAGASPRYWYDTSPFRQYTNRGSAGIGATQGQLTNPQGASDGDLVESSAYPSCTISGPTTNPGICWEWPRDQWVTIMLHIKPGRHNDYSALYATNGTSGAAVRTWLTSTAPYRETILEVFAALPGQTSWTTLYSNPTAVWVYGDYNTDTWGMGGNFGTTGKPLPGFNHFAPTIYANTPDGASPPVVEYSYKFTQIIFSTQPIPCPQA